MMKLNTMRTRLDGLVIFRGILQANIVPAFRAMLAAAGSEDFVSAAADFENQLFERAAAGPACCWTPFCRMRTSASAKLPAEAPGRPLPLHGQRAGIFAAAQPRYAG